MPEVESYHLALAAMPVAVAVGSDRLQEDSVPARVMSNSVHLQAQVGIRSGNRHHAQQGALMSQTMAMASPPEFQPS